MHPIFDATALQIGSNTQLFIDNLVIEQTDCVTRRWHKPRRLTAEPILKADRPWEDTLYFTYSNFNVLQDPTDGLIKCWYEDIGPLTPHRAHPWKNRMLYATSRNGVDFEKPELGKVFIDGQNTNIYAGYVEGATPDANNPWANVGIHSAAVVIDPTSTEARYRMLFSLAREGHRHKMVCGYSSDGINWHSYGIDPSFGSAGAQLSDVSTITFDTHTGLFQHYTRHGGQTLAGIPEHSPGMKWQEGARFSTYFPGRPDLMNKRRVYRTVSADFLRWTDPVAISTPDDTIDNLDTAHYGLSQFRVGATHFGTLGAFHYVDNEMDVRLLYSHDGVHFHPTDNGRPFLEPRRGQNWDRHMVSIMSPPVRVGDEWYFYHGGSQAHHDWWWAGPYELDHDEARDPAAHVSFGMGIAALRFEGIASLDAIHPRPGRVVTKPVCFDGKSLEINARVRTNGSIRVGLLDSSGNALPGFGLEDCVPFSGDAIRHQVKWHGQTDLPAPAHPNQFRKLVFAIDEAEVFSFTIS
ncbi:MAG: hypothetical protein EOP22_15165 [Hyphomicrobiales bacterium]|nr:MAG: hypothetical protein EOP22_15165 [Hyphomicrobiales bacterium]